MKYVIASLVVAWATLGCTTPEKQRPQLDRVNDDSIAQVRTCICPKGYDCGNCCGPNHCVCNVH